MPDRKEELKRRVAERNFRFELAKLRGKAQDRLETVYPIHDQTRLVELTTLVDVLAEELVKLRMEFDAYKKGGRNPVRTNCKP